MPSYQGRNVVVLRDARQSDIRQDAVREGDAIDHEGNRLNPRVSQPVYPTNDSTGKPIVYPKDEKGNYIPGPVDAKGNKVEALPSRRVGPLADIVNPRFRNRRDGRDGIGNTIGTIPSNLRDEKGDPILENDTYDDLVLVKFDDGSQQVVLQREVTRDP